MDCVLFIAATFVGPLTGGTELLTGAVVWPAGDGVGAVTGEGAAASLGSPAAADGTRKGLFVNGQTTLEPALIPRTSTSRGGFVNGVRTYPKSPGTACAAGMLLSSIILGEGGVGVDVDGVTTGGPIRLDPVVEATCAEAAACCFFTGCEASI